MSSPIALQYQAHQRNCKNKKVVPKTNYCAATGGAIEKKFFES